MKNIQLLLVSVLPLCLLALAVVAHGADFPQRPPDTEAPWASPVADPRVAEPAMMFGEESFEEGDLQRPQDGPAQWVHAPQR